MATKNERAMNAKLLQAQIDNLNAQTENTKARTRELDIQNRKAESELPSTLRSGS
jgi:hypothetical protein